MEFILNSTNSSTVFPTPQPPFACLNTATPTSSLLSPLPTQIIQLPTQRLHPGNATATYRMREMAGLFSNNNVLFFLKYVPSWNYLYWVSELLHNCVLTNHESLFFFKTSCEDLKIGTYWKLLCSLSQSKYLWVPPWKNAPWNTVFFCRRWKKDHYSLELI